MKKYILLFLILSIFMVACESDVSNENPFMAQSSDDSSYDNSYIISSGSVEGDYIYRNVAVDGERNILLKYSVKTGEVTTVCQDPFCSHDESCPFYVTEGTKVVYIGNTVYYVSFDKNEYSVIHGYSDDTMENELIYSTQNRIAELFSYNYYLFFEENITDDGLTVSRNIICLNTQTNESVDIPIQGSAKVYEIKNDRIIWQRGETYYTTDLYGNDTDMLESLNEKYGYIYRYEVVSEPPVSLRTLKMAMYRREKNSTDETLIATGIGPATFFKDKIIYFVPLPEDEQKEIYTYDGQKLYDYYGGNVYIMNLDGSDAKLLCHAEDCYISGMSSERNNEWYCGDWIGIKLRDEAPDGESGATYSTAMLIVNIVTGEYVVCKYEG